MLIIQVAIPPFIPWFGVKPDLLLIVVVCAGLIRGAGFGAGMGFIAGLLQDLFLGGILGTLTITKLVIGGLAGVMEGKIFKERFLLPPVVIFAVTIIHELLRILLSESLLFNINLILAFRNYILPEALFNALLGILIYYLLYRLSAGRNQL